MELEKRKPVPGKNSRKGIHRTVKVDTQKQPSQPLADPPLAETIFHQPSSVNHQTSFCPHCAGNSFEELEGVLETGLCIECEHEKTIWLIQKYTADEEARKKRKFAPIEPGRKRRKQTNYSHKH